MNEQHSIANTVETSRKNTVEEYGNIIVEMLSRIDELEAKVRALEAKLDQSPSPVAITESSLPLQPQRRTNSKVTEKMLDLCYRAGQRFYENNELEIPALADEVHRKTGMNRNNAIMTIYAIIALLQGELYKRAISGIAVEYYFSRILSDYGAGKLQLAIAALRKHIDYRRKFNHKVEKLAAICDRYQARIE